MAEIKTAYTVQVLCFEVEIERLMRYRMQ